MSINLLTLESKMVGMNSPFPSPLEGED